MKSRARRRLPSGELEQREKRKKRNAEKKINRTLTSTPVITMQHITKATVRHANCTFIFLLELDRSRSPRPSHSMANCRFDEFDLLLLTIAGAEASSVAIGFALYSLSAALLFIDFRSSVADISDSAAD